MNIKRQKNPRKLVLVALLGIALLLRASQLTFGFPILYVIPDEVANYQAALTMLATKSPFTFSHYPPFGSYIQIPFFICFYLISRLLNIFPTFHAFAVYLLTHEGALLFVPRAISALFGVGSLWVGYQLAKEMYPRQKQLAFLALILLAFSTTHIQQSTIGKPIIPSVFFGSLFFYYLYKSTRGDKPLGDLLKAILALSVGTGFYFISLLFLLLYVQVVFFTGSIRKKLPGLIFMILPLFTFYLALRLNTGTNIPHHLDAYHKLLDNISLGLGTVMVSYVKQLLFTEPALLIGFLGSMLLLPRLTPFLRQLVFFCLGYLALFILAYWNSVRYLVPLFLPMAILTVTLFNQMTLRINKKSVLLIASVFILLATLPGITWFTRYSKTPTFLQSRNWVMRHVPASQPIAYTGIRFAGFVPAYHSLRIMQAKNPGEYGRLSEILTPNEYPDNVREMLILEKIVDTTDVEALRETLIAKNLKYVISECADPSLRELEKAKEVAEVAHFSPFDTESNETVYDLIHHNGSLLDVAKVRRFGPCISIWKTTKLDR